MNVLPAIVNSSPRLLKWLHVRPAAQWAIVAVFVVSTLVATKLWWSYVPNAHLLWTDVVHDRNAHLEVGLGLANDLAHGRVIEVIRDIDKVKTWPPLHDAGLVTTIMLATGFDIRFAVIPSLLGLMMTAAFAYLLTQRLAPGNGWVAGLMAALWVLVSPAQRAYATDVMLESWGAGLTLATLYAAVRVLQNDELLDWKWLALALSGLFFLKYNYWFLVVIALAAACCLAKLSHRKTHVIIHRDDWSSAIQQHIRSPWTWLLAFLIGLGLWIKLSGGIELSVFGKTLAMRSPVGVATAVYWLLLLRLLPMVRQQLTNGAAKPRRAIMLKWHIIPAALWLAWPQKLASFLWVLNPGDNVGEFPATNKWEGFPFLASALASDYHLATWSCLGVGALITIALLAWCRRQLPPGATLVVLFLMLSIWLTATHPNRKSRFAHSWIPTAWVLAGVGAGVLIRRASLQWRSATSVAALALAAFHLPGLMAAPHAPEGGLQVTRPSALPIAESYLPYLGDARRPAILSNVPFKFFARWTYMNKFGRGTRPITEIPDYNSAIECAENERAFQTWLDRSHCDAIVLVEFPVDSPWYVPVPKSQGLAQLKKLCLLQQRLAPTTCMTEVPGAVIAVFNLKNQ